MSNLQESDLNEKFNYFNITISGLPGCGSTTLLNQLKNQELLEFAGWNGFSGGEFMRAYALEKGLFKETAGLHHSSLDYEDDFDRQIDLGIREKVSNDQGWIIESWLSGFFAQGVPGTLKILMKCSDDAVRIDRIVNRDGVTPLEAKENMYLRYQQNYDKWRRLYSNEWQEWLVKTGKAKSTDPIDFWREDLYDIVIDTYSTNQQETLRIVLDAIIKTEKDPSVEPKEA
jgi:cytidylate kinase